MREIIVTEMLSLGGVIEAPGGETGYRNAGGTFNDVEFDPAAYELKGTEQEEAGALLLGRRSYEVFAPFWPSREEFAGYNAMPRFVVSTTLEGDDERWPATILRSLDEVKALKTGQSRTDFDRDFDGPLLVHGSATLVRALQEAGSSISITCWYSRCCWVRERGCLVMLACPPSTWSWKSTHAIPTAFKR